MNLPKRKFQSPRQISKLGKVAEYVVNGYKQMIFYILTKSIGKLNLKTVSFVITPKNKICRDKHTKTRTIPECQKKLPKANAGNPRRPK